MLPLVVHQNSPEPQVLRMRTPRVGRDARVQQCSAAARLLRWHNKCAAAAPAAIAFRGAAACRCLPSPSMELQCPICLEADMDGRWYQCDNGHYFCRVCYNRHVDAKWRARTEPRCPECRIRLPDGEPIYCLAAQKLIPDLAEEAMICKQGYLIICDSGL